MPRQPVQQTQEREAEAPLPGQRHAITPGSATWDAFGGAANLVVADRRMLQTAADLAQSLVAEVQRRCSARQPDSDLTRANAAAGRWVDVDPLLVDAVTAALRVAEATAGLVGPLDWARIGVDPAGRIRVPAGGRIDLGTTLRAFAADLVATQVPRRAGSALIIGLGGDVAVGHLAENAQQWRVTLSESANEMPDQGVPEQVLLEVGGLATVTLPTVRRGKSGVPHLLDPRTGLPVEVIWRSVTVSAATCLDAHAAASAALVMGDLAPAWLWEHDLAARLIGSDGRSLRVAGWPES